MNSNPIVVANANPAVAITGAPQSMDEGASATLGSTVTDASADDTTAGFTYLWTAKKGGATVATAATANFTFSPAVHGAYAITLKVTDKDGGATTTSATNITVANVAPSAAAVTGLPNSMNESQTAALTGSASDASGDTLSYSWNVTRNGNAFTTATGRNFTFTPHARGNFAITLTATDTAGSSATVTRTITVANVAPTATAIAPTDTVLLGETTNFGLSIADVPDAQAMTVTWDYGDGQFSNPVSYTGNKSDITAAHTYTNPGTYLVAVTVSDGVDATTVTKTVVVSRAVVRPDGDTGKTALTVLGSSASDTIKVEQQTSGKYKVTVNGIVAGSDYAPTGKAIVYGAGGDNSIVVTGTIDALVFAGNGNNSVVTGGGNDTVVGGAGADYAEGGFGRDVLIGMGGADQLHGGDSEDLLIANVVSWSGNSSKLAQVGSIWNSNKVFADRVTDAKASGLFGTSSIAADAGADKLWGEAKGDWFVFDAASDRVVDLAGRV